MLLRHGHWSLSQMEKTEASKQEAQQLELPLDPLLVGALHQFERESVLQQHPIEPFQIGLDRLLIMESLRLVPPPFWIFEVAGIKNALTLLNDLLQLPNQRTLEQVRNWIAVSMQS